MQFKSVRDFIEASKKCVAIPHTGIGYRFSRQIICSCIQSQTDQSFRLQLFQIFAQHCMS